MRDFLFTQTMKSRVRFRIFSWFRDELDYVDSKYASERAIAQQDAWMREGGISNTGDWQRQIVQYWDRANLYGLDKPAGRQAMMKSAMTMIGFLEAMYRVHGEPPAPGVPSGEIK